MKPLHDCRLYTFVDSAYLHGREPVEITKQLCEGGSDLIQLRAKTWPAEEIEKVARAMISITRANGVRLVINDHLEIARTIGAEFCHLGQEDFFDAGYQKVADLPETPGLVNPAIGLSTHAPAQAERAIRSGADYVAIGPVFATGTKPTAEPVTLDYVRWAAAHIQIPWFAIGGINLENLEEVLEAGARRICVVSAILNSMDIVTVCQKLKDRVRKGSAQFDERG